MTITSKLKETLTRLGRSLGKTLINSKRAEDITQEAQKDTVEAGGFATMHGKPQIIESPAPTAQEARFSNFLNRETRRALRKDGRKIVPVHANAPKGTKNVKRVGYEQALRNFAEQVYAASKATEARKAAPAHN